MSEGKPVIAIVDDDESVCRALKRLVRSLGMEADVFLSGRKFVDLIEAILDVQMPGITGLDVQRRLAAFGSSMPIIFITAHDEAGVRERALRMGALAFLRKPFDDELFIRTLRAALARSA
jgi:FixJ family two-component response regulator